ncbi:hypothetical protein QM646_18260, partial [Rhodococcus erythropolis]|nr:hypothetical protein [Rhodococcus erythropolis]
NGAPTSFPIALLPAGMIELSVTASLSENSPPPEAPRLDGRSGVLTGLRTVSFGFPAAAIANHVTRRNKSLAGRDN